MVPTVSLSFLHRRTVRQVCRVCHEIAELKTERLCAVCVRIKAQIRSRFPDAVVGQWQFRWSSARVLAAHAPRAA